MYSLVWFDGYICVSRFHQLFSYKEKKKKVGFVQLLNVIVTLYFHTLSLLGKENYFVWCIFPSLKILLTFSYLFKKNESSPVCIYGWKERFYLYLSFSTFHMKKELFIGLSCIFLSTISPYVFSTRKRTVLTKYN